MAADDIHPGVKDQYERFPYPHRDPAEESRRLVRTWLDDLPMLNNYCFRGMQRFDRGFRVLVAGGGTGDATIFLAHQLRDTDGQIVHVDISSASIAVAQARATARGLANIRWVERSLLQLTSAEFGRFDYINCAGVLHHLDDPDAGLRVLLPLLADGGALGIMLYGLYGRTGIYQMQSLLKLVNAGVDSAAERLANAKRVLAHLPPTNWFMRAKDIYREHITGGDPGLYDMLLHEQDRAYTVEDIYGWFGDRHGLHLQFTDVQRGAAAYRPRLVATAAKDATLWSDIDALPSRRQAAIAELIAGNIGMHVFYATQAADTKAPYGDADYVPFFFHEPVTGPDLANLVAQHGDKPFVLNHSYSGVSTPVDPGRFAKYVLRNIDGQRTFGEIFERVRADPACKARAPDNAALFEDLRPFWEVLSAIDRLLLRHRSAPGIGP
jgi:ubiquinone/menaquinone biosynthesis C-methylase UbiE